jgi:hypothetical protein
MNMRKMTKVMMRKKIIIIFIVIRMGLILFFKKLKMSRLIAQNVIFVFILL